MLLTTQQPGPTKGCLPTHLINERRHSTHPPHHPISPGQERGAVWDCCPCSSAFNTMVPPRLVTKLRDKTPPCACGSSTYWQADPRWLGLAETLPLPSSWTAEHPGLRLESPAVLPAHIQLCSHEQLLRNNNEKEENEGEDPTRRIQTNSWTSTRRRSWLWLWGKKQGRNYAPFNINEDGQLHVPRSPHDGLTVMLHTDLSKFWVSP